MNRSIFLKTRRHFGVIWRDTIDSSNSNSLAPHLRESIFCKSDIYSLEYMYIYRPLSPPPYQEKELDVMGFLDEIGLKVPVEKQERSSSANPHGDNLNLIAEDVRETSTFIHSTLHE